MAGLGPDANLLRFVRQHVMGKVRWEGWGVLLLLRVLLLTCDLHYPRRHAPLLLPLLHSNTATSTPTPGPGIPHRWPSPSAPAQR